MTMRIEVAGRCLELIVRIRPASSQVQPVPLAGHGAPVAGVSQEQAAKIAGEEVVRFIREGMTRPQDGLLIPMKG